MALGGYWLREERSGPESIWGMIAAMRLSHHAFLLVPLLAASALAVPPPCLLLDVYGTAAAGRNSETLLPARAAHRVTVRVPPLHWAAIEGDVAEVKRLIAAGADLTATKTLWGGERALHWAAHGGSGAVRAFGSRPKRSSGCDRRSLHETSSFAVSRSR